jgi:hypothetical protein
MTDDAKLPSTRKALQEQARQAESKREKRPKGAKTSQGDKEPDVRDTLAALRKLLSVRGG